MGKNTSITLSDHFESFVAGEIASGRFGNTSEVIRAGLRLLEEQEQERQAIRAALIEGENSGEPIDGEVSIARIRRKYGFGQGGE